MRHFLIVCDIQHVEQLLRTLNLNSPDPKSPLSLSFDGSSEYSPASVSSVLLTPTDLSPTRTTTFDAKLQLQSPYGNARTAAYLNHQSSLLFEPASPTHPGHSDPYAAYPHGHGPHAIPYYNDATKSLDQHHQSLYQVSPTLGSHPSLYNSPTINSDPASLRSEQAANIIRSAAASDWHVPQTSTQPTHLQHDYNRNSDWLHPDTLQKPSFAGLGLSTPALDTLNTSPRSSYTYQVNSSPQSAHEVRQFCSPAWVILYANEHSGSQLTSLRSYTLRPLPRTLRSLPGLSSRPTSRLRSSSSRSSRLQTPLNGSRSLKRSARGGLR